VSIVQKGDVIRVVDDVGQIQRMQNNHGGWLEEMKIVRVLRHSEHLQCSLVISPAFFPAYFGIIMRVAL
jgi:hypothetical protein